MEPPRPTCDALRAILVVTASRSEAGLPEDSELKRYIEGAPMTTGDPEALVWFTERICPTRANLAVYPHSSTCCESRVFINDRGAGARADVRNERLCRCGKRFRCREAYPKMEGAT